MSEQEQTPGAEAPPVEPAAAAEEAVALAAAETGADTPPAVTAAGAEAPPVEPAVVAEEASAPEGEAAEAPPPRERRGRPRDRLEDLQVGTQAHGKVVGLAKFGVFVDIGAVQDGLVHISEFEERRVRNVEEVMRSGDEVDVWIKAVDLDAQRIALSMRRRPERPIESLHVGDVLIGKVTSLTKYGAFVDIGSDTDGLVHISEMSGGFVARPEDVVHVGDSVEVRVKELDSGRERIGLSMVGLASDPGTGAGEEAPSASELSVEPSQPAEERAPTVVELALRRAFGQDTADAAAAGTPAQPGKSKQKDLSDVYTRMLEEYRATKAGDG
jgi:predicted RNA-binding protein with RPS1 domain